MPLSARARSRTHLPVFTILAILILPPLVLPTGRTLDSLTLAFIYAAAAVGVDVFSGYAGQITIGNFGFVAIGAYTAAVFSAKSEWNLWLALPLSMLVAALLAAVLGMPMIRLGELGSAFITFFFAALVPILLGWQVLAGTLNAHDGLPVPPLSLHGTVIQPYGSGIYYLAWAFLVASSTFALLYANSHHGRALRVVKRSPVVASALGIHVMRSKLVAFIFSATLAGGAGFFMAQILGYVTPDTFPVTLSLTLFLMVMVGGLGSVAGPICGAIAISLLMQATREAGGERELLFAITLLAVLIFLPQGLYGGWDRLTTTLRASAPPPRGLSAAQTASNARIMMSSPRSLIAHAEVPQTHAIVPSGRPARNILALDDVRVSFGGLRALQSANLTVTTGAIHALMGPNGAGKTTILNCISGLQRFDGSIKYEEHELRGLTPQKIRALGITRTFQNPALVDDLTIIENVAIGARSKGAALGLTRSKASRDAQERAEAALAVVGVGSHKWNLLAGELSLAEQKLTDIARALAAAPRLLLLDEPTAGLHEDEIAAVRDALSAMKKEWGTTVLVIAHHVGFLREVANEATVLDFGAAICGGHPDEVVEDPKVIEVFLGAAHV